MRHFFPKAALTATLTALLLAACGDGNKTKHAYWLTTDDVHVACDNTLQPIIDEEAEQFGLAHPEASMKVTYCSEDSALRLLLTDSVNCVVATRELTQRELDVIHSYHLAARQTLIAYDAFALVTNKQAPDTLVTVDDLRGIVTGKITRWEQLSHPTRRGELKLVFDHSGSSTVRYMRDSLCNGRELQGNLYAQGTNEAVLKAVREDPDIIGVVGTDWLKPAGAPVLTDFETLDVNVLKVADLSKIKKGDDVIGWRPYQYRIGTGDYPLVRSVHVITTDPRRRSMTKYFFFFLKGQKGQTIICNSSQMLPNAPVQFKGVSIP